MIRLVAIGEAFQVLGVSIATLRRWEAAGKLIPERTVAGHRRYDLAKLKPELFHTDTSERRTVARDDSRPLRGIVRLDDAYLGGEKHGGQRGRGAAVVVAAVEVTEEGQPVAM